MSSWPHQDELRMSKADQVQTAPGQDETRGSPQLGPLRMLLLAGAVFLLIVLLARVQLSIEAASAEVVRLLPIGFAFAAGMVATVNPCGFMLLPAYLSYQLGLKEDEFQERPRTARLVEGLTTGGVATLGFLLVFVVVGGLLALAGQWVLRVFPHAAVLVGVSLAGVGIWLLLAGREMNFLATSRITMTPEPGLRNVFLFGIVYAIGSLSCTLPIFLAVVGSSLVGGGLLGAVAPFFSYGLGMGIVLMAVTVASAFLRRALIQRLKGVVPWVHSASAMFLFGAGVYLVYYWLIYAAPMV